MEIPRENILGIWVSVVNMQRALEAVDEWIETRTQNYVCVTPAHSIMDCWQNPELRPIFNQSGMTTPDGMSIVWLLRAHGHSQVSRVYGPDLMLSVCNHSVQKGYRHFFYGGAPGVAEQLAKRLQTSIPGLQVVGTYSPPFRPLTQDEDRMVVELINQSQPDILWIGISSPKQDLWMSDHKSKLSAPVLIGVGAAFDFLSGNKKQAPVWIQQSGFEWLYRFINEPRRLWKRYALYPLFVILVTAQMIGLTRY